jgi:hypothetical protein
MSLVHGTRAGGAPAAILKMSLMLLVLSLVGVRAARADGWGVNAVVTYNQAEWGVQTNPAGMLVNDYFDPVYASASGVFEVGNTTSGYYIVFTNAVDVIDYLPASGLPGPLNGNLLNPTTSPAGQFGGEVTALALNLDFSNAGLLPNSSGLLFGNLVLTGFTGSESSLNGMTVDQFFGLSQAALAGQSTSIGIPDMEDLTANVNAAFDNGQPDTFAQDHLVAPGSSAAMPEPSALMLLAIGIFTVALVTKRHVPIRQTIRS